MNDPEKGGNVFDGLNVLDYNAPFPLPDNRNKEAVKLYKEYVHFFKLLKKLKTDCPEYQEAVKLAQYWFFTNANFNSCLIKEISLE